jgi:hypothetical protein
LTDAALAVLVVFGLAMIARGLRLAWRLRADPPGEYTSAIVVISLLCSAVGVAALAAAAFRSLLALWTMIGLMFALPVTRIIASRGKDP